MISRSHTMVVTAAVSLTVWLGFVHPVFSQLAPVSIQSPPQKLPEDSRDLLVPVASIDPKVPLKMVFVNQSKTTLEYGLTTGSTQRLAAGKIATLNRFSIPAYAVFYPLKSSSNQYQQPAFKFDVMSNKNVVKVKIRQLQDGAEGDSVIRVRRSGSILVD
jgi:hypothetical protein